MNEDKNLTYSSHLASGWRAYLRHAKTAVIVGTIYALGAIPAYSIEPSIERLIHESQARQEQMKTTGFSKSSEAQSQSGTPTKSADKYTLQMRNFYNPTIEKNLEDFSFGPILLRRPFDNKTGRKTADMIYFRPLSQAEGIDIGAYANKDMKGNWHMGPTLRAKYGDVSASLDLTGTESSLYLDIDGFKAGPLNFKNPKALDSQWEHALRYNLASLGVQAVAGREIRKKAQQIYGAYQLVSHPTPLGFVTQIPGAVEAHKSERGFFRKLFKTAAHIATFGVFCDRKRK